MVEVYLRIFLKIFELNFEDSKMGFPERLKELRLKKGLTQKELADKIGKSKQMIIKYEKNQSEISTTVLTDISKALGVTSDSILSLANNEIKTVDNSPLRDVAIFLSFFEIIHKDYWIILLSYNLKIFQK